jgi:hypothetical protein
MGLMRESFSLGRERIRICVIADESLANDKIQMSIQCQMPNAKRAKKHESNRREALRTASGVLSWTFELWNSFGIIDFLDKLRTAD